MHEPAVAQYTDAVGQRERFRLVVGDVHRRCPAVACQRGNGQTELLAHVCVQVGQRLVEQQQVHPADQCTRQGHPLLLTAGQLVRVTLGEVGKADPLEHLMGPSLSLGPLTRIWRSGNNTLRAAVMWGQRA